MIIKPATIHVVDDDPSFRVAIARLLRAGGYQVALYESGQQLLANPPSTKAGCILLDMRMPELDGIDVQGRLNEIGCGLPIIFLTGHGSVETSVQVIKAGAEEVRQNQCRNPYCLRPLSAPSCITATAMASARKSRS